MQAYGQTDTGCVRTRNQDYIYFSPEQTGDLENLFFLADGMGGYQAGDYLQCGGDGFWRAYG